MRILNKKTLVIGASTNPARYSYMAVHLLREYGHDVVALAKRPGRLGDVEIQTSFPENERIHTVALYIGPSKQQEYTELVTRLSPKRVIFNPGTENTEFYEKLQSAGIEIVEGCTLVMLRTDQF